MVALFLARRFRQYIDYFAYAGVSSLRSVCFFFRDGIRGAQRPELCMASRFGVDLYVLGGERSSERRMYDSRNEYFGKHSSTWSFLDVL